MSVKSSKTFAGMAFLFLLALPATAAERPSLTGHIPAVVQRMKLTPVGPLPADARLTVQIGLPLRHHAEFNQMFKDLYNPASPQFHQWLTPDQIGENYGPADSDYQAVIAFALSNHLQVIHSYADHTLLTVNGVAGNLEKAFHLKLQVYQHPVEARTFYAPDTEPSVDLAIPILHITGLDNFYISRPGVTTWQAPKADGGDGGVADYTPDGTGPTNSFWGNDFRSAYAPGVSLTGSGQIIGLYSKQGYYATNIQDYETRSGITNVLLTNVLVDGVVPPADGGETSLDIEMAASMAPGVTEIIVYQGTNHLDILKCMQTNNLAQQLGSSWSLHADTNMDTIFMMNAMQGQSFFQSSGDSGAYCPANQGDYADDPYVTIVGGTILYTTTPGGPWFGEITWPGSGGGISTNYGSTSTNYDNYSIPFWQQGVNMSFNGGSTTQRNSPDVSMVANNIWNEGPGGPTIGAGTSFSTPLWAGFMALVNQQAAALGKPRVGFINPVIYAIDEGPGYKNYFHDITIGSNPTTNSPIVYYATNGYDLCTGWGSPNGLALINALVAYAGPVYVDFTYNGGSQTGAYDTPFKTLAGGTNAVAPGGTIIFKSSSSSSETMTIAKPMTMNAINGPATIGN